MHAWNWESICKPEKEGGMGIRRIKDLNLAASLKLIWRVNTSNSLWSMWMKSNYFPNCRFWDTNYRLMDSRTWKRMYQMKEIANIYMNEDENWSWMASPTGKFSFGGAWEISTDTSLQFSYNNVGTVTITASPGVKLEIPDGKVLENKVIKALADI